MPDGDYSSSESDDEHSSAASDVALEHAVKAISHQRPRRCSLQREVLG
jgi:hypothetical protein